MIRFLVSFWLVMSSSAGTAPLFENDTVLHIQLTGPLTTIIKSRKHEKEQSFVLSVDDIEETVTVNVRGKSRKRVCKFPPLRIKFPQKDAQHSVFSHQSMLRVVTHCNKSDRAEANVLKELLAYRIFNQITDASYKVRLLRITYVDTTKPAKKQTLTRYGFVTESEHDVADRMGGELLSIVGVPRRSLNLEHSALVYVFQYLIGNTDWSLRTADGDDSCCHNGQLIQRDSETFYVPYDFDLSGLVNPRYAKPGPSLPIRRVTSRLYRGLCVPKEVLRGAISKINERHHEIMNLFHREPQLSPGEAKKSINFVQDYFAKADQEKLVDVLHTRCL